MTDNEADPFDRPIRRDMLLAGASLAVPAWARAQGVPQHNAAPTAKRAPRRGKPLTAAEEAEVARAVAENAADQTGEPVHPAVGLSPRLHGSVALFDGRHFSEAQVGGKLLLVFYWASWCPVCKVVAPRLHDFWLKNRSRGVEVLALSTDTDVQPALAYIQRTGYRYPVGMAAQAQFGEPMRPRSLPSLLVRSKLGVIVSVDEGDVDDGEFRDLLVHL